MALWAKARLLPIENLRSMYGDDFPIEVRHYLATFIEEKFLPSINIDLDNLHHEQYVSELFTALIQEIEKQTQLIDNEDFLTKMKLSEAARMFVQRYSTNPMELYTNIRQCLAIEVKLVQSRFGDSTGLPNLTISNSRAEILRKIEVIKRRTNKTALDLQQMIEEREAFILQYNQCTKYNAFLNSQPCDQDQVIVQNANNEHEKLKDEANRRLSNVIHLCMTLTEELNETIKLLDDLQLCILEEELNKWKREQQLSGNGANFTSSLDTIQEWYECLVELIWMNWQQMKKIEEMKEKWYLKPPGVEDTFLEMKKNIIDLLRLVVTSAFIIEKQPPQVMKTNTRFTATVRLLVGSQLGIRNTPPNVTVTIISEAQANLLVKDKKLGKNIGGSGEILNNTGTMEYQANTRQMSVSFRNMQLKKIKRAEKKGTESVMDEKFSLLFQSHFSVSGGEMVFDVWTLSLPVVVIVHGNQEPHAWATVTWDNAFSNPAREAFMVPDRVLWKNVAETLSLKFKWATGRGLTDDNLRFLAEKAFRGNYNESPTTVLSWAQFSKEPLTEKSFTFWEWFFAIMKLTREHLRGLWCDGAIMGFVRRKQAEEMLSACQSGTFLLRFSDSEIGGITIAWVTDKGEVLSVQPFSSKDFAIRSLADRISDLTQLSHLYPDIPKDMRFGKYYTPYQENQPTTTNGYVRPLLVTQVPGWTGSNYGGTPQHSFLQSPDPMRDTPSVNSSYAGSSVHPSTPAGGPGMEYLGQFDDTDLANIVNLNELMQVYKQ